MPAPKVRTTVPGVYSRGSRFMAVWRDHTGRQRTKTFRTFDAACAHRRDALWAVEQKRFGKPSTGPGSMSTLYGLIRRAAQEADRAGARAALAYLYEAEDATKFQLRAG